MSKLTHYGVLGMKWGVRKAKKKDSLGTRSKIKRYNTALKTYEDIKRSGSSDKKIIKRLKTEVKKSYKDVKLGRRIDRGNELIKSGATGKSILVGSSIKSLGVAALGQVALQRAIKQYGYSNAFKTAILVGAGSAATYTAISLIADRKVKDIDLAIEDKRRRKYSK